MIIHSAITISGWWSILTDVFLFLFVLTEYLTVNEHSQYLKRSPGALRNQKRSKTRAIRMDFDMLHSEAYKNLNYAPALKVLNWFHEKVRLEANKKRRGKVTYNVINEDISFTYKEALFRGLSSHQFSKVLKELHRLGFIDIQKPGSALKGDWSQFTFSDRWREFKTPSFKNLEMKRGFCCKFITLTSALPCGGLQSHFICFSHPQTTTMHL